MPSRSALPIEAGVPGPKETARYTQEMLKSLKRIAERQKQPLLAHLLDLAAIEAGSLAQDYAVAPMTPMPRQS